MANFEVLRLVDKVHYDQQYFTQISVLTRPLPPNSIRIRTRMIGLTANNLTYCLMGTLFHWWSAFPPPYTAQAPYNDSEKYGVSPCWGYCEVLGSTIDLIPPGSIMKGFLPMSAHTIGLQLRQTEVPNHFVETSAHRSKLANLYQRYELMPADFDVRSTSAAWSSVLKIYEAGSSIARYLFPQDGTIPVHPLGDPSALGPPAKHWTTKEADLNGSCIVCVGSGSKTARAFLYQLAKIALEKPPTYSVVEVTSSTERCRSFLPKVPFRHQVIGYDLAAGLPDRRKYIIVNFAGRDDSFERTYNAAKQVNQEAQIVCLQVGSEAKVFSADDMVKRQATTARIQPWQMNATGVRDAVMARTGEEAYFRDLNDSFDAMLNDQEREFQGRVLGLSLRTKQGIEGKDGAEDAWNQLCAGQVSGEDGVVLRLDY